jgi:sporulation protein YunB
MRVFLKSPQKLHLNFIIIVLIIIVTIFLLVIYNKSVTPKINEYSKDVINKFTYEIIMNYINNDLVKEEDFKDILSLTKNKDDEILLVDFNLPKAYELSSKIANTLEEKFNSFESGIIIKNDLGIKSAKHGIEIDAPLFINSNNALFSNMGPKIPIKTMFIGSIETNLKTNVSSYGLNNSLAQIYVEINITENIITPVNSNQVNLNYEILLDSKLVSGRVPSYYGNNLITKESAIN